MKGDKITHINIMSGISFNDVNDIRDITIFITSGPESGFDEKSTYIQKADLGDKPTTLNKIKLDKPYEIEDDTPLFIGYYFELKGSISSYYAMFDGFPTDRRSFLYAIVDNDAWPTGWYNQAPIDGSLQMSVDLEGDNLPKPRIEMLEMNIPSLFTSGQSINYEVLCSTRGSAGDVTEFEVETKIGEKVYTQMINAAMIPNTVSSYGIGEIDFDDTGIFEVTSTITKVNGVPNPSKYNSKSATVAFFKDGYPRNIVLEEGTGTWCGYCVRGIAMCEYVRENYFDRIYPIAVHNGDRMEVADYQGFIGQYISGFPSVMINRTERMDPGYIEKLDNLYKSLDETPAYAMVDFDFSIDGNTLTIEASTEFGLDTDVDHQLSFVVVEDGVGPYKQYNYYSGGNETGLMESWCKAPYEVDLLFDDVARKIDSYPGIPGSLPEQIEAGKKYTFSRTIDIAKIKPEKARVVAMLTNTKTGEIVNAKMKSIDPASGITAPEADFSGLCDAFTTAGIRIASGKNLDELRTSLPTGIYIIRSASGAVSKIAIR